MKEINSKYLRNSWLLRVKKSKINAIKREFMKKGETFDF